MSPGPAIQSKLLNYDGLRGLEYLRRLDISNNYYIEKIDGSKLSCVRLTYLDLSSNKLASIKNLGRLGKLKTLKLNGNKLVRLRGLDKLKSLTELYMDRNELIDISHLAFIQQLSRCIFVRMHWVIWINAVLCSFRSLTNLSQLYIEGNPICDTEIFVFVC